MTGHKLRPSDVGCGSTSAKLIRATDLWTFSVVQSTISQPPAELHGSTFAIFTWLIISTLQRLSYPHNCVSWMILGLGTKTASLTPWVESHSYTFEVLPVSLRKWYWMDSWKFTDYSNTRVVKVIKWAQNWAISTGVHSNECTTHSDCREYHHQFGTRVGSHNSLICIKFLKK